jgi:hypothetical protein
MPLPCGAGGTFSPGWQIRNIFQHWLAIYLRYTPVFTGSFGKVKATTQSRIFDFVILIPAFFKLNIPGKRVMKKEIDGYHHGDIVFWNRQILADNPVSYLLLDNILVNPITAVRFK